MKFIQTISATTLASLALASSNYDAKCSSFTSGSFEVVVPNNNQNAQIQDQIQVIKEDLEDLEDQVQGTNRMQNLFANLRMNLGEVERINEPSLPTNRVIILLDKTGSMDTIVTETIEAYNNMLTNIAPTLDDPNVQTKFTFILFDEDMKAETFTSMNDAEPLDSNTYVPDGVTALYDAIGCTLNSLSNEENNQFHIISDGEDNDSRIFTTNTISDLVEEMVDDNNWDISFWLGGGDIDAAENMASEMGILQGNSFTNNGVGIQNTVESIGNLIQKNYRNKNRATTRRSYRYHW